MNENQDKYQELLYNQYLRAIDARDKLQENYHRWMTFYYVALGSILVTIVTLINSQKHIDFTFLKLGLSILATFISLVWHLSCKGYNYWSNSWMLIIKRLELSIIGNKRELAVYTDFSVSVINGEKESFGPLKSGNISTPKLTLLVSFSATIVWSFLAVVEYFKIAESNCCRILGLTIWIIIMFSCYTIPLRTKCFESRKSDFKVEDIEEFRQN